MATKHDSNKDIFRGQLFVFVDGKPIAYASSASLNVSTEEVDVSNKMMGNWSATLPGKNSFTVSSESLLTQTNGQLSFGTLLSKQIAKETLEFAMGETIVTNETNTGGEFELDKSKPYYQGIVMITSLDLKSDNGAISTCSVSFKGVGALVEGTIIPTAP